MTLKSGVGVLKPEEAFVEQAAYSQQALRVEEAFS